MPSTTEINFSNNSILRPELKIKAVADFVQNLNERYPGWKEFFISNKFDKQVRILLHEDRLIQIGKTVLIGNLLVYLDKNHKDWLRFGISNSKFKEIPYYDCAPGMLIRPSTSNTNMYTLVTGITELSPTEKEVHCYQEGRNVTFNSENCKKYKFAVLSNAITKEDVLSVDWPEKK